jgi:hypothetical protein
MDKILLWLFFAKIKMASCIPEENKSGFSKRENPYNISKIAMLAPQINENSGLAKVFEQSTFWTINDSGGKNELYEVDSTGKLISTLNIPNSQNTDWEDLAQDNKGNVYIGDFGNNFNNRKDLAIYKINPKQPDSTEKITFNYADQTAFPPQKEEMNFDCEAFFWANDSLYLFSKNRGTKFTKMYTIPSKAGNYVAKSNVNIFLKAYVTSADIRPDGKEFALLSYGKLFLFGIDEGKINFSRPLYCMKAPLKQSEAISYIANNELLITNEQREVFKVTLK